jgi:SAM-dependent methyltransferase
MPSQESLEIFYNGFMFEANKSLYDRVKSSFSSFLRYLDVSRGNARMLDIGGGGGFHAKAFEDLGYGEASYIDLDPEACRFARSNGVSNVVCGNAENPDKIDGEFDLVFARHLIEHLVDPVNFIESVSRYLKSGGQLVLLFPNGESKEYLSIVLYTLRRLLVILRSNRWSLYALVKALSSDIHHGIDPPRHLWAISENGIRILCERNGYSCKTATFQVDDRMVSPYFGRPWVAILHMLFGRLLSRKNGAAHLLCVISKP